VAGTDVGAEAPPQRRTRIQTRNRRAILEAALELFSTFGYRGATLDQIAARAGMSKPNLIYYFPRKEAIYRALLEDTLDTWLDPLKRLDPDGDPAEEIGAYIAEKLAMSRDNPKASRLFATEILQGAPAIGGFLRGPLKALVDEKAAVIRGWAERGLIAPVDPYHLIFTIWAVTQHYADFDIQVRAVLGREAGDSRHFADAAASMRRLILGGLAR
jgi:TetR/AcrR family transcriptional regulator